MLPQIPSGGSGAQPKSSSPLWGLKGSARELLPPSGGSGAQPILKCMCTFKMHAHHLFFAVKQEPTDGGVVVPVAVVWCGDGGRGVAVVVSVE